MERIFWQITLLNTEETQELIKIGNREINEVEVEELTIDDVKWQWEI